MFPKRSILCILTLAFASFASGRSSHSKSLNLYVDGEPGQQYVGSVVAANCGKTTIALVCTAGEYGEGMFTGTCDGSSTTTATYAGTTSFEASTVVATAGAQLTMVEACSLSGTTEAACSAFMSVSANGQQTASSTQRTMRGSDVHYYQVLITAGASRLPATKAHGAICNAAAPTGQVDMYKVVVVPAAALIAGAAMLG